MSRQTRNRVVLGLLLAVLSIVVAQAAYATVRLVPHDYATIQAAINAAANGDVVIVSPGRYLGSINFKGKGIIVRSTNPASVDVVSTTIIDGNLKSRVVNFVSNEPATAVLSGFTVTRGKAPIGAGIYCTGGAPTISYCLITGNTATGDGGGVHYAGDGTITRNAIRVNTSGNAGGGVFLESYSPKLTLNVIQANQAQSGAGVATSYSDPVIADNVITGNKAAHGGGGVLIVAHTANIVRNVIAGNSAPDTGAGLALALTTATVASNTIAKNTLSTAISAAGVGSLTLKNSIVAFNTLGAVKLLNGATATIRYCDFYSNGASQFSGTADGVVGLRGNISGNPLFADMPNNDFHEKSNGGRWSLLTSTWIIDSVQSPCIDAGDPAGLFSLEPAPNGGRLNMGAYGNTAQASKAGPPPTPALLTLRAAAVPLTSGGASVAVTLSAPAEVEMSVLNMAGQQIAVVPAQALAAGTANLLWNGRNASGTRVPSGMFLLKLTAFSADGSTASVVRSLSLKH